jgi:glycosyltransferase involved in cell wall biosynthesis
MRIGMAATRLGDVDGVSFEVAKWQHVLERLGHEVVFCAGALDPGGAATGMVIPEMHFAHHPAARVTEAAFDPESEPALVRAEIERLASPLHRRLRQWVEAAALDRLIVQNAWAIPMHLPLGLALTRVARETQIPTVGHHHDYWWERERFATSVVPELLDEAFPPDLPNVRHVSINSPAAKELRRRRRLESMVVPNVFDFDQRQPSDAEARARAMRSELGVGDAGLLVVQPTRVVPRKGIELAIEAVARLAHPSAILLITSPAGDEGFEYLVQLEQLAHSLGVDLRYGADRFRPDPDDAVSEALPQPTHSLIDAYLAADVVTYPSLYEGFGNALLEAVFFRRLLVVNRYPVYEADIRPLGFRFVELDGAVTDEAVGLLRILLADADARAAATAHNVAIGRRHLGYDRLARALAELVADGQPELILPPQMGLAPPTPG